MKSINYYLLVISLFVSTCVFAAKKMDTTFMASSKSHKLYYSLPDNCNPSKQYPLVVGLHYCGGTAESYRNSLSPLSDSLELIVVCPDNSSNQIPDNELDIITAAADSARLAFSIDSTAMFLTGMSCNGELTLRQGLRKFYPFKGIFPWVPWITSTDYSNYLIKSDMKTVIAVGTNDQNFSNLMNLYDSLMTEGADINLVLAPGIGHEEIFSTFSNTMISCLKYLNSPNTISINRIDDVKMFTSDLPIEVTSNISYNGTKELGVNVVVSNTYSIDQPTVTYSKESGKIVVNIKPKANRTGKIKLVVEAFEIGGSAIAQSVFKVVVEKKTEAANKITNTPKTVITPSPDYNYINIKQSAPLKKVEIFDINGSEIIQKVTDLNNIDLDISRLAKGTYFIRVQNIRSAKKFIKN